MVARRWEIILARQGWRVVTVAGEGDADRIVDGLGLDPSQFPAAGGSAAGVRAVTAGGVRATPEGVRAVTAGGVRAVTAGGVRAVTAATAGEVEGASERQAERGALLAERFEAAVSDADLVVAANLCSLPLNLTASAAAAQVLAGRRSVLHHHDLPWQRERFAHITELPPRDDAWKHVVVNRLTAEQMAERGIEAKVVYNPFETSPPAGDRSRMRRSLGVEADELLAVHPVRAITRKNIPAALAVCEALGATYWLTGQAEEGYDPELSAVLSSASCRVLRRRVPVLADLYAAADLVLFTSTWEGFGNPPVEAAVWGLPAVVGGYPVADELSALGFRWFSPSEVDVLTRLLAERDGAERDGAERNGAERDVAELKGLLAHNRAVAERHLSMEEIGRQIADLLAEMGF